MPKPLYPTYPPSPSEMKFEEKYIIIQTSTIPGAGLGAFAIRNIPKGTYLGVYRGEKLTTSEYAERYPYDRGGVYVFSTSKFHLDARDESKSNWLRYINGCDKPSEPPHVCNVEFRQGLHAYALTDITAGDELLTAYGPAYWTQFEPRTPFDDFVAMEDLKWDVERSMKKKK